MNRFAKFAAAAAVIIVVIGFLAWLVPGNGVATIAWADVQRQILTATTASCQVLVEMEDGQTVSGKMFFKEPGRMRQEASYGVVTVFDIEQSKAVTLMPKMKKAIVVNLRNLPEAQIKQSNMFAQIKNLVEGAEQELGEDVIDGRYVKGYRTKEAGGTMEIWVDAQTGDPVRLEMQVSGMPGKVTVADFVLNPQLDDELFSLEIPEDYQVEQQEMDFGDAGESDLVEGIRVLAKYNDGRFPKAIMLTKQIVQNMDKAGLPRDEVKGFTETYTRMIMFMSKTVGNATEWQYVGEGVELGDSQTPVLWWRLKGAETYRVIYGDLCVRDVAPEDLPKAPEAPAAGEQDLPE